VVAAAVAGGPELFLVIAAGLLGKETVSYFWSAAKNWLVRVFFGEPTSKSPLNYFPGLHCPSGFSLVMESDRQVMQTVAHGRWC
jgi:hypothetical protein